MLFSLINAGLVGWVWIWVLVGNVVLWCDCYSSWFGLSWAMLVRLDLGFVV